VRPDCLDEFWQRGLILCFTVLPAVHAIVEMDDIKRCCVQNQFDFIEQYRVGHESGRGETRHKGFPGETLFHFRIIIARDGIADEQDAGEIGFVRMGNSDVAPLDGFASGWCCSGFLGREADCETGRECKAQK